MKNKIKIDDIYVGEGEKPFIVAELSANHNGSIDLAKDTLLSAKKCGADAVKIQTYSADTMTIKCNNDEFKITDGLWKGYELYDLYKWAETPFEWHKEIFNFARQNKIILFSTPFDETAVDLLEDLNAPAYKIASFEATDLQLIKYVASTKKPLIISTGLANFQEISELVETAKESGCNQLILLHCVSSYPAPIKDTNLRTMQDISNKFNVPVGLSDHTIGNTTSLAAIALGACMIEKHFILSKSIKSADAEFSLTPHDLESLCNEANNVYNALGNINYSLKNSEEANIQFRRSIYFVNSIKENEVINKTHIRRIRPGFGLEPKFYNEIIGKKAVKDIEAGTAVNWDLIK